MSGKAASVARPERPEPRVCVVCGRAYPWVWCAEDAEWEPSDEEWNDPLGLDRVVCRRRCWIAGSAPESSA